MKKFKALQTKYLARGVSEDNIEYAITEVKDGTKREYIMANLVADYRGMTTNQANQMLNEMFAANGGEFKKENRGGYWSGIWFLIVGFLAAAYIYYVYITHGDMLNIPWEVWAIAISCIPGGISCILLAMMGQYRDDS